MKVLYVRSPRDSGRARPLALVGTTLAVVVTGCLLYWYLSDRESGASNSVQQLPSATELNRSDPEAADGRTSLALVDMQWLRLSEIPERDRAFLWAAGLLGVGGFFSEVEKWGDDTSYPVAESECGG